MDEPRIKTIQSQYIIKLNGDICDTRPSLKEARVRVKELPINDNIFNVSIVKQTITETIVDTYKTKTTTVLVADQLDEGLE